MSPRITVDPFKGVFHAAHRHIAEERDDLAPGHVPMVSHDPDFDVPPREFVVLEGVVQIVLEETRLKRPGDLIQLDVEDALDKGSLELARTDCNPREGLSPLLLTRQVAEIGLLREVEDGRYDLGSVVPVGVLADRRGFEKSIHEIDDVLPCLLLVDGQLLRQVLGQRNEIGLDVVRLSQGLRVRILLEDHLRRHHEPGEERCQRLLVSQGLHFLIHACLPSSASAPCYRHINQQARDTPRSNEIREAMHYPLQSLFSRSSG